MSEQPASPATPSTSPAPEVRPAVKWIGRGMGVAFGLLLAWLLIELMIRAMFFSLPARQQLILTHVKQHPFTDERLLPDPIWQSDTEYLTIARPVQNLEQYGSADVAFTVSTATLWDSRPAFRTRQELVDRRVDGVAVGDSFTFCFTDEDDCWVQMLAAQTDRNLINLGIVSTGSVSHLRVLQNFGMPLQPPLVIWQWFGNDANEDFGLAQLRGETEVDSPHPPPPIPERGWWDDNSAVYTLLRYYLGPDDEFDAALQFHDPERAQEGDVDLAFGQAYLWDAFDMEQPHNQDGWERGQAAILEAQRMVSDYGGTLLIVLMPTKEQVYRELSEPLLGANRIDLLQQSYNMMLALCQAENLECIDLLPTLRQHTDEQLYFTTDMHLNPRGNEVLAGVLADWLARHPNLFTDS